MPSKHERRRIYELRQELEKEGVRSWARVYEEFPEIPKNQVRKIYTRERRKVSGSSHEPSVQLHGRTPEDYDLDEEEVWRQAVLKSRRKKNRLPRDQYIEFSHGPVCLVFMADLHLGDSYVDYDRLDGDSEIVTETPGMYMVNVGDAMNNFIIGNLMRVRLGAEFSVSEEWVMVKRIMKKLAPSMVLSVAGNHDLWTYMLTGIDYMQDVHARVNPNILYAKYDNTVSVRVGGKEHVLRARHKWKGYSQYNATHGIEWAAKFDKGRHFDIGIAAHTHVSGLYRQFNNGGKTGHAIICGSYKFYDEHSSKNGFPLPNEAAAVALIIDENGTVFGTNDLTAASEYMYAMYSE